MCGTMIRVSVGVGAISKAKKCGLGVRSVDGAVEGMLWWDAISRMRRRGLRRRRRTGVECESWSAEWKAAGRQ